MCYNLNRKCEDMNKKVLIGIAVVLFILIIGCGVLLYKINSDPKPEEKIAEKKDSNKKEKEKEEQPKEDKKTEEKKEEATKEEKNTEKKEEKKEEKKDDGNSQKVPDLTGLTLDEAIAKLNANKIKSSFSIQKIDSDKPKDTIVKTEPAAGSSIDGDLQITFYFSKGPKNGSLSSTSEEVKYPDFTNGSYKPEDVKKFCDKYGVKVVIEYDEPDGTQIPSGKMPKEGVVFAMDKTTNDIVKKGDTLTIKVARY